MTAPHPEWPEDTWAFPKGSYRTTVRELEAAMSRLRDAEATLRRIADGFDIDVRTGPGWVAKDCLARIGEIPK